MVQKSRDRRLTDRHLLRRQDGLEFGQRDIRLLRHQFPDQLLVSRQSISLVPAELGRTDAARFAVQPAEADDRADAHSELLRNFRDSRPSCAAPTTRSRRSSEYGFPISYWPPSSTILESDSCPQRNPARVILFGKCSNVAASLPFSIPGSLAMKVQRAPFAVDCVQARVVISDVAVRRFARI